MPDECSQVQYFVGDLLPEYRSTTRFVGSLSQAFTLAKSAEGDIQAKDNQSKDEASLQKPKYDQAGGSQQKKKWQGNQS